MSLAVVEVDVLAISATWKDNKILYKRAGWSPLHTSPFWCPSCWPGTRRNIATPDSGHGISGDCSSFAKHTPTTTQSCFETRLNIHCCS